MNKFILSVAALCLLTLSKAQTQNSKAYIINTYSKKISTKGNDYYINAIIDKRPMVANAESREIVGVGKFNSKQNAVLQGGFSHYIKNIFADTIQNGSSLIPLILVLNNFKVSETWKGEIYARVDMDISFYIKDDPDSLPAMRTSVFHESKGIEDDPARHPYIIFIAMSKAMKELYSKDAEIKARLKSQTKTVTIAKNEFTFEDTISNRQKNYITRKDPASPKDIITTKNGEVISANIIKITSTEIKYKKFNNADTTIYTIPKSELFSIGYESQASAVSTKQNNPAPIIQTENLFLKGQEDASKYYEGYGGARAVTTIVSVISPLIGLIPAIACSSTTPRNEHLTYHYAETSNKPEYLRGYKSRAKSIKSGKVWKSWGIGAVISLVLTVALSQ